MDATIPDLMHANLLEVFGERDRDRRRAAIARTYTEDVVMHDPEGVVTGRDALDAKVQTLLDGAPGFVFRAAGPLRECDDLGLLGWEFGPEGEAPVVTGLDIVLVVDGRITSVHTILT
ncbi:nuclear transport factor 2 family protein [Actinomycetospora endophytica]|uniref:Nuclear transport factor 2 family protein n=1 Tax=Actinomycetospora endophytica TaxID=2291215 RepID=A0ABS8PC06_9PSEU|nr:nuclear transport factor 2 family protein [Actinomycetospora endophytica]MCD2194951.1 nuclear transport factor 2 family protein [Actinomycetospora endophytica]